MTYFLRGIPRIASLRFGANFFLEIEEAAMLWKFFFYFHIAPKKNPAHLESKSAPQPTEIIVGQKTRKKENTRIL